MITAIRADGRTTDITARTLTDGEAHRIATELAGQGIKVEPVEDPFGTLHLWAAGPVTTVQEVTALRTYARHTDARLAWHKAVA